jgi:hypothetical protein
LKGGIRRGLPVESSDRELLCAFLNFLLSARMPGTGASNMGEEAKRRFSLYRLNGLPEVRNSAVRVDDQGTYMLNHLGGEDDGRTLTQSVHALDQTPLQIQFSHKERNETSIVGLEQDAWSAESGNRNTTRLGQDVFYHVAIVNGVTANG